MKNLILILLFPSICLAKTRIAVIDTGLSKLEGIELCNPVIDLTDTAPDSFPQHGDNITHIIADGLTNYCIIPIKIWDTETTDNYIPEAIYLSIRLGADIINISGGGSDYSLKESGAVRYADFKHIIIVAAAGNAGINLDKECFYFPGCYPTVVLVGNIHPTSNYGTLVDVFMKGVDINSGGVTMTGSSQATAMFTHELAKRMVMK